MEEARVVVVGAGPSGVAISACLSRHSIPHLVFEREDCCGSLWKKRAYDRLHLHLAKLFCALPFSPHSSTTPMFMSKDEFVRYLDDYVSFFNITPRYRHSVESASYDEARKRWRVEVKDTVSGDVKMVAAEFLVVASGENSEAYIPRVTGLDGFKGEVVHSSGYKTGSKYRGKEALVVGCGNSGMEIAFDLSNFGAQTSIVVRGPFHVVSREMVLTGMLLLKSLPVADVDAVITLLAETKYGDLEVYGIRRPTKGPFSLKEATGRSPVIDVGTIKKIRAGEIKVVPRISRIQENTVVFENGEQRRFDVIIFATGYKSSANSWLKDYRYVLNGDGMPKKQFPHEYWKGEKGLYCGGLSRRGLQGVSEDAVAIADDIKMLMDAKEEKHDGANLSATS